MAAVEIRDPTIKLFGKTIALPEYHVTSASESSAASVQPAAGASGCDLVSSEITVLKDDSDERREAKKGDGDGDANQITDQTTSEISDNPSVERESSSPKASKNEEQSETSISQDKTPKKPDKILPCPRCNSMDTKFCYYNNYNVNQPRHFCKKCQRYWTAGGSMRNVPVGAGRRKNKNASSQFRHLIVHENGVHHHHYLGNNGAFLTFGSDSSISQNCKPNGDNGDDHSSKSSITASNSSEKGGKTTFQQPEVKNLIPFSPLLPSFLPWPYSCSPQMGSPAFYPPGFPISYFPAAPFWGSAVPPSINHNGQKQGTGSSVLGKHSRDEKITNISGDEDPVSRVDDPSKSSKWSSSINGGGLFAGFQAKGKEDDHSESCSLLQANPAAFSRALRFRETA